MKKSKIFSALVCAALLCAGCSTVKQAREVQKAESQRPGERTVTMAELGIVPDRVMQLSELESIAVRFHPDVILAQEAVEAARLAVREAGGDYLPNVNASLSHSRNTHNVDRHAQRSTSNTGNWSASLSMNWTIYDFGKTKAAVKRARENLRAAEQDLRNVQSLAIYNVRTAFFELMRAIELDKVAQEAVEQYKEHLEQVKLKKEVGKSNAYELRKAEVDWNNAVLSQITTSHNIQNALGDLNKALGFAEEPVYKLGQGQMKEYELDLDKMMALAEEKEPALASLNAKVAAASLYIDRCVATLYPSLSVNLAGTLSGRNTGVPWLWNLSGGASLAETIFNGGTNLRQIESASIELRKARTQVSARKQDLYQKLRKAILTAQRAEKQLEVATLAEKQALDNLNLVNEQFNVGKASSVERTDAQVSHSQAKASAISARYDRQDSLAAIAYLTGDFTLPEIKEKKEEDK